VSAAHGGGGGGGVVFKISDGEIKNIKYRKRKK